MKPDETGIATNQPTTAPAYRSNHLLRQFGQQKCEESEKSGEKVTGAAVMPPSTERIMYNKIQGANASACAIVQGIRTVDEAMQQIGHKLEGMKQAVETILKNYPPFPAGSNERIVQLRQFSALRKMIDQLTFPPKDENSPTVILGDHQNQPSAGDWVYVPDHGSIQLVIRQQQVHSGEQGLNLPDLTTDASDDDLVDAMERLAAASKTLEGRHQQFVADANRIITQII